MNIKKLICRVMGCLLINNTLDDQLTIFNDLLKVLEFKLSNRGR